MKTTLLIILLGLLFYQSYSQEFDEEKFDIKLQTKYKDTLQSIGKGLTGKWKYLGKANNGILSDTIFVSLSNNIKTTVFFENGIIYELENSKRKKVDYYYETSYEFKNGKGYYSEDKKYLNEETWEISSCQPIPELIYYQNKFGILFIGMIGSNFEAIRELTAEKLSLGNGKEYLKID